jgi:cbb3-type cytochrome oxidase maturation protein
MNVLVYLVPMAVGLGLIGLIGFLWALKSGQYSDVDGAALRVLSDDDIEQDQPAAARSRQRRISSASSSTENP